VEVCLEQQKPRSQGLKIKEQKIKDKKYKIKIKTTTPKEK